MAGSRRREGRQDAGVGAGAAKPAWHHLAGAEALRRLEADPLRGLSAGEARRRLTVHGPNRLPEQSGTSLWAVFAGQFRDFMVLVLLGATAVSYLLGEVVDAIAIAAIVFLNAILGAAQEFRAERSLAALKRLASPRARVLRDGRGVEVPSAEVVPGDILLLSAGDRVAADVRLIEAVALEADEAALTGESVPVPKVADDPAANPGGRAGVGGPVTGDPADEPVDGAASAPGDRRNMAYQGTVITRGHGRGVVVATGRETEVGGIAGLIQEAGDEVTPLQRRLDQLGRYLVLACLGISAAVAAGGLLRGEEPHRMLLTGVSLAVAAIPEGLPAVVTIVLALGVQRMLRRRAIIRRLPAVETLGCATIICSDKTGTLTRDEMTARALYAGGRLYDVSDEGHRPQGWITLDSRPVAAQALALQHGDHPGELALALAAGTLCNNAVLVPPDRGARGAAAGRARPGGGGGAGAGWRVEGDPTEGALLVLAGKAGLDRDALLASCPRLGEIPFESERKMMTVICGAPGRGDPVRRAYVKGAPERLLELCASIMENGRSRPLGAADRARIIQVNETLAGQAMRVLALACRDLPADMDPAGDWSRRAGEVERDLTFLGLVGLIDPPRPGVAEAVRRCRQAGIRVAMVTGDHALTARAIAAELDLLEAGSRVVTGAELDRLDDAGLSRLTGRVSVYARVSPAHKLRIVRALKAGGERVAMTGDGVNDAPALKEADIGVAMGLGGTEVAKEAADMVLADDNFATIVGAIEEGRAIYDNIRKFIRYLLSCNTGEVLVMFLATLLGLPPPLLPIQILLVNLVTDGLPAIALGVDPPEPGLMARPPRPPGESVFARGLWRKIILRGVAIAVTTLSAFAAAALFAGDLVRARTVATAVLAVSQLMFAFECRSEVRGPLLRGMSGNRVLLGAVTVSLTILVAVLHVPILQRSFHLVPLSAGEWIGVLAAAAASRALTALPTTVGRRLAGAVAAN